MLLISGTRELISRVNLYVNHKTSRPCREMKEGREGLCGHQNITAQEQLLGRGNGFEGDLHSCRASSSDTWRREGQMLWTHILFPD